MEEFVIEGNVLVKYNGNSETVIVPEGIKQIGEKCFKDNTTIRRVFLPKTESGCLHVGFRAFEGCKLQFIRGVSIGFHWGALAGCSIRDIFGDFIIFDDVTYVDIPKNCRIHTKKSESVWKFCREHSVPWIADWGTIIAKEKDADAAVQLPILTQELKDFRKANRMRVYMNKVIAGGTPYWFCVLFFLAVSAAAYQICGNIEVLQQYYLRYLTPIATGLVSLLLLKIVRLIWKAIRFHNKSGAAYQAYEKVTTLEKEIHEHRCNVLTAPALKRLDEEQYYLQLEFKSSGWYAINGSMSVEDLDAALRHSYNLGPRPTSTDPNKDANSKGNATGLAD